MKRTEFIRWLRSQNCDLLREGSRHSWWYNMESGRRSAVPRHNEINEILARKICKDLGIPSVK